MIASSSPAFYCFCWRGLNINNIFGIGKAWEEGLGAPQVTQSTPGHTRLRQWRGEIKWDEDSLYLHISGSTAGARTLGSHRAERDTWLCYISHSLSKREHVTVYRHVLALNPTHCDRKQLAWCQNKPNTFPFRNIEPWHVEWESVPLCTHSECRTLIQKAPDKDASCLLDCKSCFWKYTTPRALGVTNERGELRERLMSRKTKSW